VTHALALAGCNIAYNTTVAAAVDAFDDCTSDALALEVLCLVFCGLVGGPGLFFCAAACLAALAMEQTKCATDMADALRVAQATRATCTGAATVARTNCIIGADAAYDECITQAMEACVAAVALCP